MAGAASNDDRVVTAAAAGVFAAAVIVAALWINSRVWRRAAQRFGAADASALHSRNTRLAALVYAWGSAALFAVYGLSGLTWRHGWQYGLGMALIAAGLMAYVRRAGANAQAKNPPLWPALLHGAAAAGGLVYLVGTGKLETLKRDWAANDIFLFGGIAILALSIIASLSQLRLSRAHQTDH